MDVLRSRKAVFFAAFVWFMIIGCALTDVGNKPEGTATMALFLTTVYREKNATLEMRTTSEATLQVDPATRNTKSPIPTLTPPPSATERPTEPRGKIVFTCQVFGDAQYNQICLMNADGSSQRRMTTADSSDHTYASLAPDGRSIVFTSNQSGGYEIYEMDINGNQNRLTWLGDAYAPEVSPDGSQVVFTYFDGTNQTTWRMDRDGGNVRQLYRYNGNAWDPTWSPDGTRILFASDRSGGVQLFTMKADGTDIRQVTDMSGLRGRSDWSPDGFTLATYAGDTWNREIVLMDLDGRNLEQLTEGGNNLAPSFSPDGMWIAFTSYMDHYGDGNGCEIYIMRVDGSEVRRLTDTSYCDWQPRWGK
jgi:TolB protein